MCAGRWSSWASTPSSRGYAVESWSIPRPWRSTPCWGPTRCRWPRSILCSVFVSCEGSSRKMKCEMQGRIITILGTMSKIPSSVTWLDERTLPYLFIICFNDVTCLNLNGRRAFAEYPDVARVESQAVCRCTVCRHDFLQTSFEFADLFPH